jgi:nucleoside-diphosphate-sugar epimerase
MLVAVTGGLGRIGRAVLAELAATGYETLCVDVGPVRGQGPGYRRADLRELWQVLDALDGVDAVVHLAGVGVPESHTNHPLLAEQATFAANTVSTYNVLRAAAAVGATRVVWASSETVLGAPFVVQAPAYLPLDDDHPTCPETSYALSKAVGEDLARHFTRASGLSVVGLRFSVVMDEGDYPLLRRYWQDPGIGRWNLWSYVDLRDVAWSCRLALEADVQGAAAVLIAAADTLMTHPTADLLKATMPEVPVKRRLGRYESLINSEQARHLLRYDPRYSWRETIPGAVEPAVEVEPLSAPPGMGGSVDRRVV